EYEGRSLVLGIRPENIEDASTVPGAPPDRRLTVICTLREALGAEVLVHFSVAAEEVTTVADQDEYVESLEEGSDFVARARAHTRAREGRRLELVVDTRRLHFFDPETGEAIYSRSERRPVAATPARA